MSDPTQDPYDRRRVAMPRDAASPLGAESDQSASPLPFGSAREIPILPRYGASDAGAANGAHGVAAPQSFPASSPEPVAPAIQPAVSDLPTARMPATLAPAPSAPPAAVAASSVSDLPTTRMSSAPAPAPQISDLPTQRVKATTPPDVAPPDAPPLDLPAKEKKGRPRTLLVVVAVASSALLVVVSAALLVPALRSAPSADTSGPYHQSLTSVADGWPNSGDCRFTASGYQVSGPSACFYSGQDVHDASVSVTVRRMSGGTDHSAGVAFRRSGPGAFYTFEMDGEGNWVVYKRGAPLKQGESDVIKTDTGASNTLDVQMKGGHFTFSINGVQVGEADDAEFTTGQVGLTGYTGLQVVYTDFTITPLHS
jgi:hypothetical protein